MGVKSLIWCKNDDHKNLMENELRGFLMLDCQTNREVDYYLPDFDIDMALGLDATGLTVSAAPQSSSARLEASPAAAATAAAGEGVDESDSDEFEEGFEEEQPAATDPVHPSTSVDDELYGTEPYNPSPKAKAPRGKAGTRKAKPTPPSKPKGQEGKATPPKPGKAAPVPGPEWTPRMKPPPIPRKRAHGGTGGPGGVDAKPGKAKSAAAQGKRAKAKAPEPE
jgi:hypothetical protein